MTNDPLDVRCAWCGAAPGELCTNRRVARVTGRPVVTVPDLHGVRVRAARELVRWETGKEPTWTE